MKKYAYNEITTMQYISLIFTTQVGVGVLPLPANLVKHVGTDSWVPVVLGWVVVSAVSLVIIQVMKRYPEGTLPDLLTHYGGKWAGRAGAIVTALYFAYYAYVAFVRIILYVKVWLLPQTPDIAIVILLTVPTWLIARNGLRVQGRYAELVVFVLCWMPFVYMYVLKEAHLLHLLPLFKEGWTQHLAAVHETIFNYIGFEMAFIFYPFLKKKHLASAGVIIGNTLSMLVYLLVTFTCLMVFSPDEIKLYNEPGISVLKIVEFPFLERFEVLFLTLYLVLACVTWISTLYCTVYCTSWLVGKKDHSRHLFAVLLLLVVLYVFYAPTFNQNDKMISLVVWAGTGYAVVLPFILWIFVAAMDRYRKRG
ncbi:GerAB/ArcD/ProY family transporter [Paenibacillus harenae]|uniref:Spore germination protein (Amino acid permease) n=1 Tax=Paenibacillus harenae TaxID=306543 RepID=A0ABT9U4M3_PAEHA|nr:endospore germination permease [Paenibacillus harenae]MDQ0114592.1 spore germination protein (amino acid permease) [Paenibacillus harenae]